MEERLTEVRKMLLEQKREILQKMGNKRAEMTKQSGDFIDIATDSLEHELNYIFEERDRDKLHNIDQALKRMKEGMYGECDECGDDIEIERLMALPFTRLCLDCKAKQERQKKLRIYVDQDS